MYPPTVSFVITYYASTRLWLELKITWFSPQSTDFTQNNGFHKEQYVHNQRLARVIARGHVVAQEF